MLNSFYYIAPNDRSRDIDVCTILTQGANSEIIASIVWRHDFRSLRNTTVH